MAAAFFALAASRIPPLDVGARRELGRLVQVRGRREGPGIGRDWDGWGLEVAEPAQ